MEENCTSHNFISMLFSKDKSLMLLGFFLSLWIEFCLLPTSTHSFSNKVQHKILNKMNQNAKETSTAGSKVSFGLREVFRTSHSNEESEANGR